MEEKKRAWNDVVQTIAIFAILATIVGGGIAFWTNVPTKGDIRSLQGEINTLRGEINTLRGEINTLRGEIKSLRDEVRSDLEKVATKEEMKKEFDDVKLSISGLGRELDDLKTDVRANTQNHVNHLARHGQLPKDK